MRLAFLAITAASVSILYACSSDNVTVITTNDAGAEAGGSSSSSSGAVVAQPLPTSSANRLELDTSSLCQYLIACAAITSAQLADCKASYAGILVTTDCADALATATAAKDCAPIAPDGKVTAACFPPCVATDSVCNADGTLSACHDGSGVIASCADGCKGDGETYTGTCGKSFDGGTSTQAKCWCAGGDGGT